YLIGVHDFAVGDRPHIIERLTPGIAMQAPDVDSFVESGVDQTLRRRYGVADKSVTAAFPGRRFFAVKIALNILIKIRAAAAKKRIVIRRQADFDFRVLCEQRTRKHSYRQRN